MKKTVIMMLTLLTAGMVKAQVVQVKDIFPGASSSISRVGVMPNKSSAVINGNLIFSAKIDNNSGVKIWKSDGTSTGTTTIKTIYAGRDSGATEFTTVATPSGTKAVFSANDGIASLFGNNYEPWQTDGTTAGTTKISEINTTTSANPGSFPQQFTVFGNSLYFRAIGATTGSELYAADITSNFAVSYTANINNTAGVGSQPMGFTVVNNKLFFTADNGNDGRELYVTAGTASPNILLNLCSGVSASNPENLIAFNNKLYFTAKNCSTGITGVWKSDGTVAGTTMVSNIETATNAAAADFIVSQGMLFFNAYTTAAGREMHLVSPDDQEYTFRIINPTMTESVTPGKQYINYNNVLYFMANNGTSGNELWRIDLAIPGTADTAIVKDINPSGNSNPSNFIVFGGKLIFQADDGVHGAELWQTDGTEAGTSMIADINPGSGSSSPCDFAVINSNTLLFVANDGLTGDELWKLDTATLSNNQSAVLRPEIRLYPNPTNGYFELATDLPIEKVALYNMLGQLVKTYPKQNQYDTTDIAKGSYIVKVYAEEIIQNIVLVVN